MSEKILVADDSPTIQKVVGITLAKSNYELFEALNEEELLQMVEADHFDLILLDFNLSESVDGYELCKKIRNITGTAKILAMLGTFDTVEDDRLEDLGVSEKVVKPFESSKFIQKIKDSLAQDLGAPTVDLSSDHEDSSETSNEDDIFSDDGDDEWSMSGPQNEEEDDLDDDLDTFPSAQNVSNELRSEVEGWGMSVPGVIGSSSDDDQLMPPQMGEATKESEPHSNLVSIDELMGDEDDGLDDLDVTDPQIRLENNTPDSPDLASELSEEISPDDFWAVDEEKPAEDTQQVRIDLGEDSSDEDEFIVEEHPLVEVGPKLEKDESYEPTVNALNDLAAHQGEAEGQSSYIANVDIQTLLNELRPHLKTMIKEVLHEMGEQATERVAWEVIPDLAENLIRQEVKSLSKKVQNKHSLS